MLKYDRPVQVTGPLFPVVPAHLLGFRPRGVRVAFFFFASPGLGCRRRDFLDFLTPAAGVIEPSTLTSTLAAASTGRAQRGGWRMVSSDAFWIHDEKRSWSNSSLASESRQ